MTSWLATGGDHVRGLVAVIFEILAFAWPGMTLVVVIAHRRVIADG